MFLTSLIKMGAFELNHHWHGVNVLSILECCLLGSVLFALLAAFAGYVRRSKRLRIAAIVSSMLLATAAYAANTALSNLSASGALAGTNLIYVVQTAGVGGVKATMTQVATFINSLFSGDFTCTSGGICTVTKINGVTPPNPIGSVTSIATACGITGGTINSSGTIQGASSDSPISTATYTLANSDCGLVKRFTGASPVITIPALPSTGFAAGNQFTLKCEAGSGSCSTSGTVDGSASAITIAVGNSLDLYIDASNGWHKLPGNAAGGASPGGLSGQIQTNNGSGGFNGGNLSNDCTTNNSLSVNCNFGTSHPGYFANAWYIAPGAAVAPSAAGSAHVASTIRCKASSFSLQVTIQALGASVTVAGTTNFQLALYADSNGRPGALIGNTGDILDTSTGVKTGALLANKQVGPNGANGGRSVWFCSNVNDATVVFLISADLIAGQMVGDTTPTDLLGTTASLFAVGVSCAGANCNGGSSTYGTWPASLSGSTWTVDAAGINGNRTPIPIYQVVP